MHATNDITGIDGCLETVQRAIRESDKYKNYHELLESLKQQDGLYQEVNRYRQEYFRMQMAQGDNFLDINERLRSEFSGVCTNSLAGEFLLAEAELCKMIRRINNAVLDAAEIDSSFLD